MEIKKLSNSEFKNRIKEIVEKKHLNSDLIHDKVNNVLKEYRRAKNRYYIELNSFYGKLIENRHQLSESISIKGLNERAIYQRIYILEKTGYKADDEPTELLNKICLALKTRKDQIIKSFTDE